MAASKTGLKPLITVIIPCYNYGRLLGDALQSLQDQDCQDWECWIIDDGSTDTTAAIAHQYAALDPRINYFYQANQGQPAARNRGLEQARGDYIQFLDADDLLEPAKFSLQKAYLEQHPGTDIVYGEVRYFLDHEPEELFLNRWDGRSEAWMPRISGHGLPMLMALVEKNIFELGCALFSRHAVNTIGPFQETLQGVEDYDYCLRAAALDLNFAWLDAPETRVLMRHHSSSFSKSLFSMYKKELMLRRLWKTRLQQTGSEHLVYLNDLCYDGRLKKLQDLVIDQVRKGNTSYLKIKEMKWLWTHASNRQKLYFFPRVLKALLQRSKTSPYVNTDVTIK